MIGSFLYFSTLQLWTYIMPKRIIYLRHFSRLYRLLKIMKRSMFSSLDCKQGFIRELTIIWCRMSHASCIRYNNCRTFSFFLLFYYNLFITLLWNGLTLDWTYLRFVHSPNMNELLNYLYLTNGIETLVDERYIYTMILLRT